MRGGNRMSLFCDNMPCTFQNKLVGGTRFELATPGFGGLYSIQLS